MPANVGNTIVCCAVLRRAAVELPGPHGLLTAADGAAGGVGAGAAGSGQVLPPPPPPRVRKLGSGRAAAAAGAKAAGAAKRAAAGGAGAAAAAAAASAAASGAAVDLGTPSSPFAAAPPVGAPHGASPRTALHSRWLGRHGGTPPTHPHAHTCALRPLPTPSTLACCARWLLAATGDAAAAQPGALQAARGQVAVVPCQDGERWGVQSS